MISGNIHALGYFAQSLFFLRFFIQWISSEKIGKVVAPTLFWPISLVASFMLIVYSILVSDLIILFGQILVYYVYVRNLKLQNTWEILPAYFRYLIIFAPVVALLILIFNGEYSFEEWWETKYGTKLIVWGTLGQLIFSSRFFYQWYYSEKVKKSVLPIGFWIISISGSIIILSYSLYSNLYPIAIGHMIGLIMYVRNVSLALK